MNKIISSLFKANELRDYIYSKKKHDLFVKNIKQAISLFEEILPDMDRDPHLLFAISSCYLGLERLEHSEGNMYLGKAIEKIKLAIQYAPNDGALHSQLAVIYSLDLLDFESAATEYRIAIKLSPNNVGLLRMAASEQDNPESPITLEEAICWLERAVQLDPSDPDSHAQLAILYNKAGKKDSAKHEAIRALTCPRPYTGWTDALRAIFDEQTP